MGRAKGTAIQVLVEILQSRRAAALEVLPESLHGYLDRPIATVAWFPEDDMRALVQAVVQTSGEPEAQVLGNLGRDIARKHKKGVYTHLLHRLSRLDTQALWATQHDSGKMTVYADGADGARIDLADFDHPSREICGILAGYIEETLRMTGFAHPKVKKTACRLEGDDVCSWRTSWKAQGNQRD